MSEEKQTFWEQLFGGSSRDEREEKVLQYVIHRVKVGAHLNDVVEEEYVQRNASQRGIEQIIRDPKLVHEARKRLETAFESEELRPKPPSPAQ